MNKLVNNSNMGKLRQKAKDRQRTAIKRNKRFEVYKSDDAPQIIFDRINNAGYKRQRKNEKRLKEKL